MAIRPQIIIIAALAEESRVIGRDGKLPWHISADLKRFKRLTVGYPVLMGRHTFESILERNGEPLAGRRNIVLSTTLSHSEFANVELYPDIQSALDALSGEIRVSIIGGEKVFEKALLLADRLELTIVEDSYDGDAVFPEYEYLLGGRFVLAHKEEHDGYRFETYDLVSV